VLPHDTYGRDLGLFFADRLPFVLGTNIAGTILKIGPSPTITFSIGDHIFGLGNVLAATPEYSGLQQYALLREGVCAKLPEGFDFDEMVTFPVNAGTSFSALFHPLGFEIPPPFAPNPDFNAKSETILVIGGGSNVGKLALQYAKMAGIGQVIAIASASNETELKRLGATHVIDRHLSLGEIKEKISELTREDGLTKIYDCVSWDYTFALSLLSASKPGTLLALHPVEEAEKVAKEKGLNARVQFVLGNSGFMQPLTSTFWEHLPGWVKQGKLEVGPYKVIEGMNLVKIEEGLDSYRDGGKVVPVIVHPWGKQ
jgi:NADPH2:quinone reductase